MRKPPSEASFGSPGEAIRSQLPARESTPERRFPFHTFLCRGLWGLLRG